jgi:hypothetical protein
MAKKRTKKGSCSTAGRRLSRDRDSYAGQVLAKCRWSKPGARKKQSAVAKRLLAKMKRARKRK